MSVVGIDLGTTNTVVACVKMGRVHVIADEQGQRLLPSVVSFHPNGQALVGRDAKARLGLDGKNTVSSVKRLIGRAWNSEELIKARTRSPFEMREGPGQGPLVVARGQEYTLPEISAFVLKKAKQIAESALGTPVDKAVITVPAHFNELQRASTKVAGRVAGLEVLRILNEPTAAALAYGLGRQNNERIAVYDFGGGTFDCTLLDLSGNVFEVLASAGDTFLGGDDVDAAIADRMAHGFLHQYRYDPRADAQAFARLKLAAELIKMELSNTEQAQLRLREVAYGVGGAHLDLTFGLTRAELEALLEPLIERSFKVTQDALSLAHLTPTSFDHVILVGGSTRIPLVRKRVEQFFGMPPLDRVNPDEVVAIGAAIQAAALSDQLRRRSIPPPPAAKPNIPPTQHIPTQRGLADVSVRDPAAQQREEHALNQVRIDANADPLGQDATLSVHQPAAVTAPHTQRMLDSAPPSRTLRLDEAGGPQSIVTQTVPLGGRAPSARPIPPPPRTSKPPASRPLPPEPREDRPVVQDFPDPADLPLPPPFNAWSASDSSGQAAPRERPHSRPMATSTPSQGFEAFGAIDDLPSIMSMTASAPGAQVPPLPGQPSPIGPEYPASPALGPRQMPVPGGFGPTAQSPQYARPHHGSTPPPLPGPMTPPPGVDAYDRPYGRVEGRPPMGGSFPGAPPGLGVDMLPPAVGGFSVPPQAHAPVLVDVTPRALVVEVVGGYCDTVIPRNAKIPCERARQFTTGSDYQTVVRVRVAQGEHAQFMQNTYLGEVELSGIRPAVRGEVRIGVTFELDADGSLRIRAADLTTGQEAIATLQLVGLASDESSIVMMIDRMAQQQIAR